MCTAAASGIDVRFMMTGVPDKKIPFNAAMAYYPQLLRAGVKVYQYKAGFLHAKTVTVDDQLSIIGTCNWDIRSIILHDEVVSIFYDSGVATQVRGAVRARHRGLRADHRRTSWSRSPVGSASATRWPGCSRGCSRRRRSGKERERDTASTLRRLRALVTIGSSPDRPLRGRSERGRISMRMRRRPLLAAAVVGGTAYHVGKKGQQSRDQQNAQIDDLQAQQQQQQYQQAPPQAGRAAPPPTRTPWPS